MCAPSFSAFHSLTVDDAGAWAGRATRQGSTLQMQGMFSSVGHPHYAGDDPENLQLAVGEAKHVHLRVRPNMSTSHRIDRESDAPLANMLDNDEEISQWCLRAEPSLVPKQRGACSAARRCEGLLHVGSIRKIRVAVLVLALLSGLQRLPFMCLYTDVQYSPSEARKRKTVRYEDGFLALIFLNLSYAISCLYGTDGESFS